MFKQFLFVAAFAMASSPAFVSAQDFFFSFDEFSRQPTLTQASPAAGGPATGQLFIFGDAALDFNQIDLDFTVDNPGVATFTNGVAADSDGSFTLIRVEDPSVPAGPILPTFGRLFGASVGYFHVPPPPGQDPALAGTDAEFRPGANGFLLGTIDYSVNGPGTANFDFILGAVGVVNDALTLGGSPISLDPDFAGSTSTLTVVDVPEPSSAILLILVAAGMVNRRRRS